MSGGRDVLTAGDLLTLPELRALRQRSAGRGLGLVLHAWAVIAGAMLLHVAWPSAGTLLLAVALIGARQLGLAVLMHEAAHWLLLPQPRANTRLAAWLCAYPIGEDLASFRRRHHLHHRHTQQPEDPDLALGSGWPMTPGGWWLAVLRDLTGVSAAAAVLGWRPWRDDSATWRRRRGPLVVNAVILGLLVLAGQGHLYLLLWLLPLATWYRLAARVRTLAEHALVADDGDPLRNARTTGAGWLARAFLAPYRVNFHLEHHLAVFVPCWRLPTLHALLVARARGAGLEVAPSYAALVRRATSGPVS